MLLFAQIFLSFRSVQFWISLLPHDVIAKFNYRLGFWSRPGIDNIPPVNILMHLQHLDTHMLSPTTTSRRLVIRLFISYTFQFTFFIDKNFADLWCRLIVFPRILILQYHCYKYTYANTIYQKVPNANNLRDANNLKIACSCNLVYGFGTTNVNFNSKQKYWYHFSSIMKI